MKPIDRPASRVRALERMASCIRGDTVQVLSDIGHEHRGHPGAALSIADIVTALYYEVMTIDPSRPAWPDRDRLVLSKGHGCMSLYVALSRLGYFPANHLRTFRSVDSILQGHPDMRKTPGIDMTSGSLGHGLAAGVGLALDARARRSRSRTYVLLGDGELQEGLIWEGAMAAAKYGLTSLTAFVDCNGLQSSGRIEDLMPLEPLGDKWRAFGWHAMDIDGHDMRQILDACDAAQASSVPTVILARTVKGKGVSYMEGNNTWHQACPPGDAPVRAPAASAVRSGSTRAAFGRTLVELAAAGSDVMVLSSDTRSSMGLDEFSRRFPDRHIEVGIAEQNLLAIAAGLAAAGRPVVAATYATFASMRALEQFRTFICYPRLPVTVVAGLGGLSAGIEGVAHLGVEDLGILRCLPNLTIFNPADAVATPHAIRAAVGLKAPSYVRLGRDDTPIVFDDSYSLAIGKGRYVVRQGWDAALLTSGLIVSEVVEATRTLLANGIRCTVAEFPTIKPLDADMLGEVARSARAIFTIEEHSVIGGLGSAVLETLAETRSAVVRRIGVNDCFLESGTPEELRRKYGLTASAIARRVLATRGSSRLTAISVPVRATVALLSNWRTGHQQRRNDGVQQSANEHDGSQDSRA
jgi:transketolase